MTTQATKLTLAQAMAAKEVERHNSAIGNAVCVLTGIAEVRRLLNKELARLDEAEAYVTKLADQTEEDPISVNDDERLHKLNIKYGGTRGGSFTVNAREA